MNGENSENALIRVVQLPIIEDRLRALKESVDKQVEEAVSLACTEETLGDVKKTRTEIRKVLERLESQRMAVKKAVMDPYNRFEATYKECVSNAFKRADANLKRKIDEVENTIKKRCEDGLRQYFVELCEVNHLDWLTYERAGIRVDMASARQKTPKKLRGQLSSFVLGVSREVAAISEMEHADEILVEYKRCLDFVASVGIVNERHRRIEEEIRAKEVREAAKQAEKEAVRKVEALALPTVKAEPQTLTVTFTVTDTRERLIALREWMKSNNYRYR